MRLAPLLVALAVSCIRPATAPRPAQVMLAIDPAFDRSERGSIIAGAEEWTEAVGPDVQFSYRIDHVDQGDGAVRVVRRADTEALVPDCGRAKTGVYLACYEHGSVFIAVGAVEGGDKYADADHLRQIACHEFGHVLGLEHDTGETVMAELAPSQAAAPTAEDVRRYCEKRGCTRRAQ